MSATETRIDLDGLLEEASLCSVFQKTAARCPDRIALRTLHGETTLTWGEYAARVEEVARGLMALGVGRGDTISIMLSNRAEFHVIDTAALHVGAASVSVYNTVPPEDIADLVRDAGATVMFTEAAFLPGVLEVKQGGSLETVVVVDAEHPDTMSLDALVAAGSADSDFEGAWRAVEQSDAATLVFTSGTTGRPKGAELTHLAILGNVRALDKVMETIDGSRIISYLPMAHLAERQLSQYWAMAAGLEVTICPSPREIGDYVRAVRPHYLFTPPRMLDRFRAAALSFLRESPEQLQAFEAALEASIAEVRREQAEKGPQRDAASIRKLSPTFEAVLEHLGLDQVRIHLIGSAPIPAELVEFWIAVGLPLVEAWGITECGAFAGMGKPGTHRIGTTGQPFPGVEVRLLDDGEVLLRSPWMMKGYRNRPEATAEAIDSDGWLHTGDVGQFDDEGNLKLVDRKKELIINAAGKNMSPVHIESRLKASHPLIGEVVAIGDGRPYIVALVLLDAEAAAAWAAEHGMPNASLADLAKNEQVLAAIGEGIEAGNARLAQVEQVKYFTVLPEQWVPGGEELTPTMKLKRKPIAEKYADQIEELYRRTRTAAPGAGVA